ncbi:MAG TPA: hypothetical protein K8W06_04675 [Limosilactobacillus coleohominis]|nr:hypothetical protein [Limosilactobacillus coleohominis]
MAMTEEDVRRIALDVYEEKQKEQHKGKVDPGWIELRKDIEAYCKTQFTSGPKAYGLQQQIYGVVRTSLGIHRIDSITGDQLPKARQAFEFIKHQRKEVES